MIRITKTLRIALLAAIVAPMLSADLHGVTLGGVMRRNPMPSWHERLKYSYVPKGDLRNTIIKSNRKYDRFTKGLKKDFLGVWTSLFPKGKRPSWFHMFSKKHRSTKRYRAYAKKGAILKRYFVKTNAIFGRKSRTFHFEHHPKHNYIQKYHTDLIKKSRSYYGKASAKLDPKIEIPLSKFVKKFMDVLYLVNVEGKAAATHLQATTNVVCSVLRIVMPKNSKNCSENDLIQGAEKAIEGIKSAISEFAETAATYNLSFEYFIKLAKEGIRPDLGFDVEKILEKIRLLERIEEKMGMRIEEVKKQAKNLKVLAKRVGKKL